MRVLESTTDRARLMANVAPIASLVLMVIVFSIGSEVFFTPQNFDNILRQSAALLIVALGGTFVILIGSIDLSVAAVIVFGAMMTAMTAPSLGPAAIVVGMAIGVAWGLVNGLLLVLGKLPSFMVTLGMHSVILGISLILLGGGNTIDFDNELMRKAATAQVVPHVPLIAVWAFAVYAICVLVAFRSRLGRFAFAIGGGERVSQLSGVAVGRYKVYIFMLSGLLAGLGGALLAARSQSANQEMGGTFMLDSIAAIVMGGTPLTGGVGGPHRTLLGVLVIGVLGNGLVLMGVGAYEQIAIKGVVIVAAVALTISRSKLSVLK